MTHYLQSSVQSNQPEDSSSGAAQPLQLPQSHPLVQALQRASTVILKAQVLCDRAEQQISEGADAGELDGFVYGMSTQIGLVGHLLDCALRSAGGSPFRDSLGEWLSIGDIEAATPASPAGASHA